MSSELSVANAKFLTGALRDMYDEDELKAVYSFVRQATSCYPQDGYSREILGELEVLVARALADKITGVQN